MEGRKFGKGVTVPELKLEHGAELEVWNRFIKRFEIALIGAGLMKADGAGKTRQGKKDNTEANFELERRKAVLLLDSMGEIGMGIYDTRDSSIDRMQYEPLRTEFEDHFSLKENIVATRQIP